MASEVSPVDVSVTDVSHADPPFQAETITRPAPVLMRYYALCSLLAGPFFSVRADPPDLQVCHVAVPL